MFIPRGGLPVAYWRTPWFEPGGPGWRRRLAHAVLAVQSLPGNSPTWLALQFGVHGRQQVLVAQPQGPQGLDLGVPCRRELEPRYPLVQTWGLACLAAIPTAGWHAYLS